MGHITRAMSFTIGPKGRSVIPAAVRREAGLREGDEVVAIAVAEGRVLIETVSAARQFVWDGASESGDTNATEDVREMRLPDIAISDAAAERRGATVSEAESAARGAALLAKLGL